MKKEFAYSALLVFIILLLLKIGVDTCLPYRSSAIFPQLEARGTFYCNALSEWDEYSRVRRTQAFESLTVSISRTERDSLDPTTVGIGDLLLFWRIPLILPLILEQVPEHSTSSLKLAVFALSLTVFLAIIIHYMRLIYKVVTDTSGLLTRAFQSRREENQLAALMGRTNASNTIIGQKKQD